MRGYTFCEKVLHIVPVSYIDFLRIVLCPCVKVWSRYIGRMRRGSTLKNMHHAQVFSRSKMGCLAYARCHCNKGVGHMFSGVMGILSGNSRYKFNKAMPHPSCTFPLRAIDTWETLAHQQNPSHLFLFIYYEQDIHKTMVDWWLLMMMFWGCSNYLM